MQMANLLLFVMGAFAEFERALVRERQLEGIAIAKQRDVYKGCKKVLTHSDVVWVFGTKRENCRVIYYAYC